MLKLVDNNHYHLWTDALHARALAHQAKNRWDRGTYVRWTIITAWTVLEMACQDALENNKISYSFRKNLDEAIAKKSLPKLDWGSGIWNEVTKVQEMRKDCIHRFSDTCNLFPEASVADNAINVVCRAVTKIYEHTGGPVPKWVADDMDHGWDKGRNFVHGTLIRKGGDAGDTNAIQIKYIYKDQEYESEILASDADWKKYFEEFLGNINAPITKVIVCQGSKVLKEQSFPIRGN